MKKILFFILFALSSLISALGQLANPITNAGTTGTTLNSLALINTSNNAVITTTATGAAVPAYVVIGGAGTTGQAQLATVGEAACTMDSTIASAAGWYYVINSVLTGGDCHAQSAAPAIGTWVIGYLASASTSSGSTSLVSINSFIYGAAASVSSFSGDGVFITNSSSTGAVTATLGNAAAHKFWGNNTGSTAAPGYQSIGSQDQIGNYVAGGGTAQAQTATLSPAVTSLVAGEEFLWLPTAANTAAAPTIAVNGLSAVTITKFGHTALVANDLTTTAVADCIYDGTDCQLQNPQTNTGGSSLTLTTIGTSGAATYSGGTLNIPDYVQGGTLTVIPAPGSTPTSGGTCASGTTSSCTLSSTTGLPTSGLVLYQENGQAEFISYTGISGATITGLTRGLYGTTAQNWSNSGSQYVLLVIGGSAPSTSSFPTYVQFASGAIAYNINSNSNLTNNNFNQAATFNFSPLYSNLNLNNYGGEIASVTNGVIFQNGSGTNNFAVDTVGEQGVEANTQAVASGTTSVTPNGGFQVLTGTAPTSGGWVTMVAGTACTTNNIACAVTILNNTGGTITVGTSGNFNAAYAFSVGIPAVCWYYQTNTKWYCHV